MILLHLNVFDWNLQMLRRNIIDFKARSFSRLRERHFAPPLLPLKQPCSLSMTERAINNSKFVYIMYIYIYIQTAWFHNWPFQFFNIRTGVRAEVTCSDWLLHRSSISCIHVGLEKPDKMQTRGMAWFCTVTCLTDLACFCPRKARRIPTYLQVSSIKSMSDVLVVKWRFEPDCQSKTHQICIPVMWLPIHRGGVNLRRFGILHVLLFTYCLQSRVCFFKWGWRNGPGAEVETGNSQRENQDSGRLSRYCSVNQGANLKWYAFTHDGDILK